jgi:hypothetical protein
LFLSVSSGFQTLSLLEHEDILISQFTAQLKAANARYTMTLGARFILAQKTLIPDSPGMKVSNWMPWLGLMNSTGFLLYHLNW